MNKLIFMLIGLLVIASGCNKKLLNLIKQEEKLSLYASITSDPDFFKVNPIYWHKEPQIVFLYNGLFGLDQNSAFLKKEEECKIFITQPAFIWCQQINTPVLLYPGETISIKMEEFGDIKFESSSDKRKKEIQFLVSLDELIKTNLPGDYKFTQYLTEHTASNILKYDSVVVHQLNNRKEFIKDKIDSLIKTENTSPEFHNEMMNYLSGEIFAKKLEYFWMTQKYYNASNSSKSRFTELISFSNTLKSHGELKNYYNALKDLAKQLVYTNSKGEFNRVNDTTSFHFFLKTINNHFSGLAKDFLIADILYKALKNKIISVDTFITYYKNNCKDKTYRLVLTQIAQTANTYEKYAVADNGSFLFPLSSSTPVSEDKIFDKYKGKLVLVDFWASWCIPCRQELPLMRELKRSYIGKDIVFLTISIDKKLSEWKKASATEKISAEDSFVLSSNDSGFVFKGHSIETIPRYMIFGKNGSLLEANAPYPSNSELKILIDKYLSASEKIP